MMLRRAVQESPGCDGVVLGGHGLFTWGETQQECYENTISIIDQLGQFVVDHVEKKGAKLFGGPRFEALENRRDLALDIFPFLRGRVSGTRRLIGNFSDLPEVLRFVNSAGRPSSWRIWVRVVPTTLSAPKSGRCSSPGSPDAGAQELREQIDSALANYRKEYAEYYRSFAQPDSPAMRDANPTVVLIPGIGMFSFGKSKTEARLDRRVLRKCDPCDGRRDLAGQREQRRQRCPRRGRPRRPAPSPCMRTMWHCLPRKHSASNTGGWKKPRFAVSLRRRN